MPWNKFTKGLESIFGYPGAEKIFLDRSRFLALKQLMNRLGIASFRPRDIADGYLTTIPKSQRNGKGVFYTPHKIVEFILDETLPKPLFGTKPSDPYPENFRILEPACGTGYFLLGAFNKLRENYLKANFSPDETVRIILEKRLAAIDIDPSALLVALSVLIVEAGNDLESALDSAPIFLSMHRADFLDKEYDKEKSPLGKLLSEKIPVIVGNPPYVSFYSKRAKAISAFDRNYYQNNYISGKGRINTYCLFIERAFDLLHPAGTLGFIIPNTLLIMKSYEPLRRYLLENGWLKSIVDLSLKVFPEVEVPTCVLTVEKKDNRAIQFPRELQSGFWESARNSNPGNLERSNQSRFENLPYAMFNIHIRSTDRDILDTIENNSSELGKFFEVRDGINPANMSDKLVVRSEHNLNRPYKPVLRGKDIGPFQLNWDNLWVRYDPDFINKSIGEYCFLREERIFLEKPKILTRQTADRIVAAWDETGYYALNTIHITLPLTDEIDLKYLLALYNSKLLNFYYRLVFPDTEKLFPQVKTVNVEKLPLKSPNGNTDKITALVDKLITHANWNGSREKIDKLIYDIYELSPEQIARIERSSYTL